MIRVLRALALWMLFGWPSILWADDGTVAKSVLSLADLGDNLLAHAAWRPFEKGFQRDGNLILCDNGSDTSVRRGASFGVILNQTEAAPIVATAWSKAEGVTGTPDSNYALYLDLQYQDKTQLWGQVGLFATGTHDWQQRRVVVLPEKPVKSLSIHLLLRNHGGKAWFRDAQLHVMKTPRGAVLFDGQPMVIRTPAVEGFQVRDVAAGSDLVRIQRHALGLELQTTTSGADDARFVDVTLRDTTGKDRAVTLLYAMPVDRQGLAWLEDPRRTVPVPERGEVSAVNPFQAGNRRMGKWPFAAVAGPAGGLGLGIDMLRPAFFRTVYNASSGELFLAYDIGLTPEKPVARMRFCRFRFNPAWGFRSALARYYELFADQFRCRTPEQGLWMPFAKISKVRGWEDFGFKFKEGNDETRWDDEHGIITFRYTEPMTWWMAMPKEMPRTLEAALAEARRKADKGDAWAKALLTSGYQDAAGQVPARLLDTPWCNGAVWSMNSMPDVAGDVTDFKNKWSPKIRQQYYGPKRKGDLDGEYIDSSEAYVTDELDFRRDHFATTRTPLCFSPDEHRPAIFRGLVAFEYAQGLADDVHAMGKLMMANSTPSRLCWLAPMLEVLGTETDWHRQGHWRPMSDAELLYRRALCKGKPYCFLMNTVFEEFSYALVEKYMKRSLAYGMFPGFFSHNASQGHYFTRPELYDRDRPLFKRYVPLCKRVAEAGWEPITLARSSDEHVYVERFGRRFLTVFNDSPERRTITLRLEGLKPAAARELLTGRAIAWPNGETSLALDGEDVAVIELN
jgi:hypothetical protein